MAAKVTLPVSLKTFRKSGRQLLANYYVSKSKRVKWCNDWGGE